MIIRSETPRDLDAIREVNIVAFEHHPFSHQTEHLIVEALRVAEALELSLVAEVDGEVVGHIAFSAASIGDTSEGWFLLGPVAVRPAHQGEGIGRALVESGLAALRSREPADVCSSETPLSTVASDSSSIRVPCGMVCRMRMCCVSHYLGTFPPARCHITRPSWLGCSLRREHHARRAQQMFRADSQEAVVR